MFDLPELRRMDLNSDRTGRAWHQIKGVKQQGKLTDDDLEQLEGNGEQLAGKLQQRYGLARDGAGVKPNFARAITGTRTRRAPRV
jgi:uncharacterized protein YjbJ (UPF0337 family)